MYAISFGKIVVSTAGTPVRLSTVLASLGMPSDLKVNKLHFKAPTANTTKAFVGLSDTAPSGLNNGTMATLMNSTTYVNVLEELAAPGATGAQDRVEIVAGNNELNVVRVGDYAVDVATSGQAVLSWGDVL